MGESTAVSYGALYQGNDIGYCKVNPKCPIWGETKGMGIWDVCRKCKALEREVDVDPVRPSFLLPDELVEDAQDNSQLRSLMEGMAGVKLRDKLIFIEVVLDRPISDICHEYHVSRSFVYKVAKKVQAQIRHNLGLE